MADTVSVRVFSSNVIREVRAGSAVSIAMLELECELEDSTVDETGNNG